MHVQVRHAILQRYVRARHRRSSLVLHRPRHRATRTRRLETGIRARRAESKTTRNRRYCQQRSYLAFMQQRTHSQRTQGPSSTSRSANLAPIKQWTREAPKAYTVGEVLGGARGVRTDCEIGKVARGICTTCNALPIVTGGPTTSAADTTVFPVGATWQIRQLELSLARCVCIGAANEATSSTARDSNDRHRVK